MEERLAAMSTDTPCEVNVKQPPVANTLSRLLQQGLLSGDSKILTVSFFFNSYCSDVNPAVCFLLNKSYITFISLSGGLPGNKRNYC